MTTIFTTILYPLLPVIYWYIAMYLHHQEFPKGISVPGHIVAFSSILKVVAVIVMTIISWILIWMFT